MRTKLSKTWDNGTFAIEFSDPSIETSTDLGLLDGKDLNLSKAMYFFYDVKVMHHKHYYFDSKSEEDDKEGYLWEDVFSVETYDFPALITFKYILEKIIAEQPDATWQKNAYYLGNEESYSYSKKYDTGGMFKEDFYAVEKEIRENTARAEYRLTAGKSMGNPCPIIKCVTLPVKEKDLANLLDVINSFIKAAIKEYNHEILLNRKKLQDSMSILGKSLQVKKHWRITKDEEFHGAGLEYSYHIGDIVIIDLIQGDNIFEVVGEITDIADEVKSKDGTYLTLPSRITVSDNDGKIWTIPLKQIVSIYARADKDSISCDIQETERIFADSLCEEEKTDLINLSEKDAVRKYWYYFVSKVSLMREEHDLPKLQFSYSQYEDDGWDKHQANAIEHAKRAVARIRKKLIEEG